MSMTVPAERKIAPNKDQIRTIAPLLPNRSAIIYKPSGSVVTSGGRHTKNWVLRFERRMPSHIEPLMGWTTDEDPLARVEIKFDSLTSAIRFAERQGIPYRVEESPESRTN
jgi:hypothetical protein